MMTYIDFVSPAGIVGGIVLITGLIAVGIIQRRKKHSAVIPRSAPPRDVVLLHQVGRAPYAPSISPFAVKLETYLRVAKIPYQNVHDKKKGSKGKIPWIEYNGVQVPDTEQCIHFLKETTAVDINKSLTPEQRATARAFQKMVDEHSYWIMILFRFVYDQRKEVLTLSKWRRLSILIVTHMAKSQTYTQGVGRHSEDEVKAILDGDFRAMSEYLGKKNYFFGDTPTEVDCAIFGQLSQFLWHLPHTAAPTLLREKYPNLVDYCERIKSNYWPDWNDCITHGPKQQEDASTRHRHS